ncbi:hypothetical protein P8452_54179 [Trifolium repens]|nr:hypothetical protein P8452_54179 [Trifolium repens]
MTLILNQRRQVSSLRWNAMMLSKHKDWSSSCILFWKNDNCVLVGLIEPEHLNPTLFEDCDLSNFVLCGSSGF